MQRDVGLAIAVIAIIVVASIGAYFLLNPANAIPTTASNSGSTLNASSSLGTSSGSKATSTSTTSSTGSFSTVMGGSDWPTYHHDNSRTGNAGVLSVASAKAGWVSQHLDGKVYAEPLAFGGKIFVATENDSVYALNPQTGATIWRTNLGIPVLGTSLPCGNINPSGITGTPVIDPATGTLYVVAFKVPANHSLVALNASNGKVVFTRPADPPGSDPTVQQERAAMSIANGMVYWPFGGLYGDCGDYHGWVVGSRLDGTGSEVAYMVPSGREAGIWGPSGAVVDASGNIFVATGNGASSTTFDHGNSVVELSPSLQELGYFAPSNWAQLNQDDADLGTIGPSIMANGLIFQTGKAGVGYLLNPANLGGIGGEVYSSSVCSSVYGGMATSGNTVFVPCTDGVVALNVSNSSFAVSWRGPSFTAGPPIVTGNVVWALDVSSGTLHGFDAKTGRELFSFNTGGATRFTTPMFAYGRLFVATDSGLLSFDLGT